MPVSKRYRSWISERRTPRHKYRMRDFDSLLLHSPTWEVVAMARAGTMVFVFMLLCQQMASVFQRSRAKVAQSLLLSIWSCTYTKTPCKHRNNPSGRFFRSEELDRSGLGCQWTGMLKEQISGLLGDKILDQSFQNGNFSPKPNLPQEYLTSTQRSPLRESHVTTISRHYKFPQKFQLLQIKLICLVEHWHLHCFSC